MSSTSQFKVCARCTQRLPLSASYCRRCGLQYSVYAHDTYTDGTYTDGTDPNDTDSLAAAVSEAARQPRPATKARQLSWEKVVAVLVVIAALAGTGVLIVLQESRRPRGAVTSSPPVLRESREATRSAEPSVVAYPPQPTPQVIYIDRDPLPQSRFGQPNAPQVDAFGRPLLGRPTVPGSNVTGRQPYGGVHPSRTTFPGMTPPDPYNPHQRR
jgi:hypothetical protein